MNIFPLVYLNIDQTQIIPVCKLKVINTECVALCQDSMMVVKVVSMILTIL